MLLCCYKCCEWISPMAYLPAAAEEKSVCNDIQSQYLSFPTTIVFCWRCFCSSLLDQSLKLHTAHISTTQLYGTSSCFGRFYWALLIGITFSFLALQRLQTGNIVKTRVTWSETSYLSGLRISWQLCKLCVSRVAKECTISTVSNRNATTEAHNRKFGTAMVAGKLDFLAPFCNL